MIFLDLYTADSDHLSAAGTPTPVSRPSPTQTPALDPGVNRLLPGSAFGASYGEAIAHGFLNKKSNFHSKVRFSSGMWQKRWMVLDEDSFSYTRKNGQPRVIIGTPSDWAEATVRPMSFTEFEVTTPSAIRAKHVFKATQNDLAKNWVQQLNNQINLLKNS